MMTLPFVLAESEWSLLDALSKANSLTSARSVSLPSLFYQWENLLKKIQNIKKPPKIDVY